MRCPRAPAPSRRALVLGDASADSGHACAAPVAPVLAIAPVPRRHGARGAIATRLSSARAAPTLTSGVHPSHASVIRRRPWSGLGVMS
ncbi:MAG: hypothetical protein AAB263_01560 [Planctomycetota bacterium]